MFYQCSCAVCGAAYQTNQPNRLYCSLLCRNRRHDSAKTWTGRKATAERRAPRQPCAYCGRPFPVVAKLRSTYCSYSCSSAGKNTIRTNGACEWRCEVEWIACPCGAPLTKQGRRLLCSRKCSPSRYVPRPPSPFRCETCGKAALGRVGTKYCGRACTPRYGDGRREVPRSVRLAVAKRDRWICWLCDERVPSDVPANHPLELTADHVVPRSLGGPDDPINLRAAHRICNSRRGNRLAA